MRGAIMQAGLSAPEAIDFDGRIHRFPSNGDRRDLAGYYCGFNHADFQTGFFGDWRTGLYQTWASKNEATLTPDQRAEYRKKIDAAKAEAERLRVVEAKQAAEKAKSIWNQATPATDDHPYLKRKQVKSYGLRVATDGRLIIPVMDTTGIIQSLQFISPDGGKLFLTGGTKKGGFYLIPGTGDTFYIVEGYATGASVREATGSPVYVAFDAGNLISVAEKIREAMPGTRLIVAADNDAKTAENPGLAKARQAAEAIGADVVYPEFSKDEKIDGKTPTDFNDLYILHGLDTVKERLKMAKQTDTGPKGITAAELMRTDFPEPRWAIPGILPEGLNILGGKPKHGKSFMALNICIAIATGGRAIGHVDVDLGAALCLFLEDTPRRLKKRIGQMILGAAPNNLHLFTEWPRMPEGLSLLEEKIKAIPDLRLVVIDTFARFKPIERGRNSNNYDVDYQHISALKELADRHGIAILLIHHLRKMESSDVFDTFSGTLGLTGAADGLLALIRRTGQADAELHITGRDMEPAEFAMKFDPRFLTWSILGNADEIKSTKERQRLYDAIKDFGQPVTPKELSSITGLRSHYIRKALPKLVREGTIKQSGYGQYIYIGNSGNSRDSEDTGNSGNSPLSVPDKGQVFPEEDKGREQFLINDMKALNVSVPSVPSVPIVAGGDEKSETVKRAEVF